MPGVAWVIEFKCNARIKTMGKPARRLCTEVPGIAEVDEITCKKSRPKTALLFVRSEKKS
jgi:hypothetical protein